MRGIEAARIGAAEGSDRPMPSAAARSIRSAFCSGVRSCMTPVARWANCTSSSRLVWSARSMIQAQPEERPALVAIERALRNAHLRVAAALDGIAAPRQAGLGEIAFGQAEQARIEVVDLQPHIAGDQRPQGARIFPGRTDRGEDGTGIFQPGDVIGDDVLGGLLGELRGEMLLVGIERQDPGPAALARTRPLKRGLHLQDARHAFGALQIAGQPEDAFGVARKQCRAHEAPPLRTQVSLVPPPCEELTTIEPFGRATRRETARHHPGVASGHGERAQIDMARLDDIPGERRAHGEVDHRLGDVIARVLLQPVAAFLQLGLARFRADADAVAAGLADRLDHQLVQIVERIGERSRARGRYRSRHSAGSAPRRGNSG